MFSELCRHRTLLQAWKKVRSNGAATGGDRETAAQFSRKLDARIARLSSALEDGSYRPGGLAEVRILRPDGKIRILRIPGIADRVVQTACHKLLSKYLDDRMSRDSFGYRPARSVNAALRRLDRLAQHNSWAFDADIRSFFDNLPHAPLTDELGIWINDPRILRLIHQWLRSFGGDRGLAQGAPISPILANLSLHPLDMAFATKRIPFVRYADDFVALARSRSAAEEAQKVARSVLRRRGLDFNSAKTRIVHLSEGFRFLGQNCDWKSARTRGSFTF